MYNRKLYNKIITIISKLVKSALNEECIAFNPALLNDDRPKPKLSTDTISDILNVISVNEVNILWDDLSVYTLGEIKKNNPYIGYPIGINLFDNKYLSLKYMSKQAPTKGSNEKVDIQFCKKEKTLKVLFDNSLMQKISNLKVELKNGTFKLLDDELIKDRFKYFNGKLQTQICLDDIKDKGDYSVAECVYKFNPGKTLKGDWYIPAIGELVYVYAYIDVINYICNELINLGYTDIYSEIENDWYWSSTFYSSNYVYRMRMDEGFVYYNFKNYDFGVLAMLELNTPNK